MKHTSYTSDTPENLKLLVVCTSAAGMLCLSLSNLLNWGIFLLLAGIHLIVWRRYFDRGVMGKGLALAVILAAGSLEAWRISSVGGDSVVPALRDLILLLATARLLMKKSPREMYQMVGIAFSQCMLATIFTISPLFLLGLIPMILLVPMTLSALDAHLFSPAADMRRMGAMHWTAVALGIVLTSSILFYVLPRPASSLIRHSLAQQNRYSFTEDVDLKSSDRVSNSTAIIMRIIWTWGQPPRDFYLSGARLEGISPDGFFKQGTRGSAAPVSNRTTDRLSVYPASLVSENVLFPFWFHDIHPELYVVKGTNLYWTTGPPPRYDLWVSRIPGPSTPGSTKVPEGLAAVTDLGLRIAGQGSAMIRAERIARYLRTRYRYSLTPPAAPRGRGGIEWFVTSGRSGTCEHFASALAAMLRGCGIPARVVTGFHVTEYNENGNYYIVRAADAHAWVEYWDRTWRTIDATPAGRAAGVLRLHLLDELRFRWIRWVIEYSLDDQIHIALRAFHTAPRITRQLENLTTHILVLFGICSALLAAYLFLRNSMLQPYEKVRRALVRKGIRLRANSTHEDHLDTVTGADPILGREFRDYLETYLAWRFGDRNVDIRDHTRVMVAKIRRRPKLKKAGEKDPSSPTA